MARVVEGGLEINGSLATDWATAKELLASRGIYGAQLVEWVKKNPNKAAVLGVGINANGRIAQGDNAVRWNSETNSIVGGQFVNRGGIATNQVGADGRILTQDELNNINNDITQKNEDAALIAEKDQIDAGKANVDEFLSPYLDEINADRELALETNARRAAATFIDSIVDFGLIEGLDYAAIIEGMPEAVRKILNDDFGGASGIIELAKSQGGLSFLAEIDRAMGHLEANKADIIRDFKVGESRLSRDLGLGEHRLNTLNERALRNIADSAASRGLARSGIRNRFEREQGEDHQYALTDFQNAIDDARVDLTNRKDTLIRQTDFQLTELGVDKGRGIRDQKRFLRDFELGFNEDQLGIQSQFNQQLTDTTRNLLDIAQQAEMDFTPELITPDPITLESVGVTTGTGKGFGEGGAPAPAGSALPGADDVIAPKKKKKKGQPLVPVASNPGSPSREFVQQLR